MPSPKAHEQVPMSTQPVVHGSTVPTQSLPRMPTAKPTSPALHQKKRKPDEEEVRTARIRERIRLGALKKQRKAMKFVETSLVGARAYAHKNKAPGIR
jgi:hypothetical protein